MKDRIKRVRKHAQMTQFAFGEKIGISRTGLQKLEAGENNPSEQTIRAICREFGIRRQWLEEGIEPMFVPEDENENTLSLIAAIQYMTLPLDERQAIRRLVLMHNGMKMIADLAMFITKNMDALAEGAQPDGKEE